MKTFQSATILILISISTCSYSQLWKQYADSAKVLNDQKNPDKAIELYSKAEEELKKDSLWTESYADVCSILANLYTDITEYEKAEPFYLKAKQTRQKVLGKEHPKYASGCHNLGILYMEMGKYEKAEPLLQEGKQIREKTLGKVNRDYGKSCNSLGNLYLSLGQYEKAEPFFLEAKEILASVMGKEHTDYAASCNNLAVLYWYMGEYKKAEPLLIEAKQIREKPDKENSEYAGSCDNLASLYYEMGDYEKARPLFLEAKQIFEKVLGKEDPEYAKSCSNLAAFYETTGEYDKAEPLYLESKEIKEKVLGKEHPEYASSCNNLSILYRAMGQYEKAESLCAEAKKIWGNALGDEHPDYAISCINLASIYKDMGQYEKAESLYLEAKQINEKALGKGNDYAFSCHNLGNLYLETGQYAKAKPLYLEAKEIWEKVLTKEHPNYAQNCNNLALLYHDIGQYEKAEPLYSEAKQIWEKAFGKEDSHYALSCTNLALLYWSINKPEKATSFYAEAFTTQNVRVNKIFQFTTEVEKQFYLKTIADFENYFLSFASNYSGSNQKFSYDVSLSNRNLILSSSRQLRDEIYNTGDTSIKNKHSDWINLREQLAFWYAKPISERPDYVNDLEEQANTLEKELTRISSAFRKEQAQNNVSWTDIQQKLKPNEAAIEFVKFNFYYGQRFTDSIYYAALLLTKYAEPKFIFLFEEKQLNNFLHAGSTSKTIAALYNKNEKINSSYRLIWEPVEKHLEGIRKIYFAPAGLLYRISFSALPVNDHQVLSDKYQLIQLNTTGSVASRSENFIDTSDKIYLYGGIKYDADSTTLKQAVVAYRGTDEKENTLFFQDALTRGSSWLYLPGTEKEINEIENLAKQKNYSVVFSKGVKASEESFKALNGKLSPPVLHIATHGFFYADPSEKKDSIKNRLGLDNPFKQSDNPLFRSGLLFAGANNTWKGAPVKGVEDGVLTAYEISNLYLPNTKLVVLSACETGLGDIEGNEGVYGLQRAFKIAGAEYLVMSLWKVPDEQTAEFMQALYKNIFDRQSVDDAFYNAQTSMKNKYPHEPFMWAAWILAR